MGRRSSASPFKRLGGKANLHRWIIASLPEHETYIEVFGGSAPVLLNKARPRGPEVLNDLDGLWTTTYSVVRDHGDELAQLVEATPYSRAEFASACKTLKQWRAKQIEIPQLEVARLHMVLMRQSFGAGGRWWSTARYGGENRPQTWARLPESIQRAVGRLRGVYLEQHDYAYILDRYDHPRATFYLDPPYLGVEQDYYDVNRQDGFDHAALRESLEHRQGSMVVSYYDDHEGVIRGLYEGWTIHEKGVTVHAGNRKRKEKELLIIRRSEWAGCRPRYRLQELFEEDGAAAVFLQTMGSAAGSELTGTSPVQEG